MYGGVGHTLGQSGQHPGSDQQGGVGLGQHWSEEGEDGGDGDAEQENPLPSVLGGKVSPWDLSEDVTVEEAGQNQALSFGIPVKIRILKECLLELETWGNERFTVSCVPLGNTP